METPQSSPDDPVPAALQCCFGCEDAAVAAEGSDEPLNPAERWARMRLGVLLTALGIALAAGWILAPWAIAGWGVVVVAAVLLWFGVSHIVAARLAYRGCPELGAIATLISGHHVRTTCSPWARADRRRARASS